MSRCALVCAIAMVLPKETAATEFNWFSDITESSGLHFKHENGESGNLWLVEIIGSGVGVFDFDGDGLLDIWLLQGGSLNEEQPLKRSDQLFKNVSTSKGIRFTRVTDSSGVEAASYGIGIATGDVDNDGDSDVFVANFGTNELFENIGFGKFQKRQLSEGVEPREWSIAGSFLDYDADGLLDLYVVNYVDFSIEDHKECLGIANEADYCAPTAYQSTADRLLKNEGNFQFRDVSEEAGISMSVAGGLGSIAIDFNRDHAQDIYVANDPVANFLWRNNKDGTFSEVAVQASAALNGDGKSEASMGLDAADFDQDCDADLFMTNLALETSTLLVNSSRGWFSDSTNLFGLGSSTLPYTGFGTGWVDFDLDGDQDLYAVNGAVSILTNRKQTESESLLEQRNQLWERRSSERYEELFNDPFSNALGVSRGSADADLDNDGDKDLIVVNNKGWVQVFENQWSGKNNWIGFSVQHQQTLAVHATVHLSSASCSTKTVRTDGSYASAIDPRIVFGLGKETEDQLVHVTWPDGKVQQFGPLSVNQYHLLLREDI